MRPRSRKHPAAFTLLELVVVLAILAVVTSLAVRAVDRVEDQRLYDANLRLMRDLDEAVLGVHQELAMDGTRMRSGFVADMGRLPRTVSPDGDDHILTLSELWTPPQLEELYNVRPAIDDNLTPGDASHADSAVWVAGGWRGPYLQMPMGETSLRDPWGNFIRSIAATSPSSVLDAEYARLRDVDNNGITEAGKDIVIVRHLGAHGVEDVPGETDFLNRDGQISFKDRWNCQVKATVDVRKSDGTPPGPISIGENIIVRVFSPFGDNGAKIKVSHTGHHTVQSHDHDSDPLTGELPVLPLVLPPAIDLSAGPRVVRAYLYHADGTTLIAASAIKHVVLQPGVNFIPLTIYR